MIAFLEQKLKKRKMYRRIEKFFKLATLGDSENMKLTSLAKDYGFANFQQWQAAMESEMDWMRQHSKLVRLNLAPLRKEWPNCCKALEDVLSLQDS